MAFEGRSFLLSLFQFPFCTEIYVVVYHWRKTICARKQATNSSQRSALQTSYNERLRIKMKHIFFQFTFDKSEL